MVSGALVALLAAALTAAPSAETGRKEFESGIRLFKAEQYTAALPLLRAAYEKSGKRASAIRALAQCERALGKVDDAILHFREYVATKPTPDDAPEVHETIRVMEAERARAFVGPPVPAPEPPPAPPPLPKVEPPPPALVAAPPVEPEEESGGLLSSPVFWIIVGVAVAGGATATGIALASKSPDAYGGTSGVILQGPP